MRDAPYPDPTAALPGSILRDDVVPAGGYWSRRLPRGDGLRIVDLEGRQAVDFLAYDANAPKANRYNVGNTVKFAGTIYLTAGHQLFDDAARPMMTILADTCGRHDTLAGCCSAEANLRRYGKQATPNCKSNFIKGLGEHGLSPRDLVMNVNFFMNVPVRMDGTTAIDEGWSRPGDRIDLRAEMDLICLISNCPQADNPCCGYNPTPIRIIHWHGSVDTA